MKHGGRRRRGEQGREVRPREPPWARTDPERGEDSLPLHFSPSLSFLHSFSGFCWQNVKDTESYIQPYWKSR